MEEAAGTEPVAFEVWPENWEVLMMFMRVQTQWRTTPMDGVIGLDYSAVRWLFELHPPDDPAAMLDDLQVMESAALKAMQPKEVRRGT